MDRELLLTEDGSHTVYVHGLEEPYHSIHGAVQESIHVFIRQGFESAGKSALSILEIGLGTGLNVILSLASALRNKYEVYYHAVEKYPLLPSEYTKLNFEEFISGLPPGVVKKLHEAPWETRFNLSEGFEVYKEHSDFRAMNPQNQFDLVYFDAFAPDKQPELWSEAIFLKIAGLMNAGGILVTYSSKSSVRKALNSCGFNVTKVSGPPGKREMIRALKR